MEISRVCCIMDFDGFSFRETSSGSSKERQFLIREIGYVRIGPQSGDFPAESKRFDLSFFDLGRCPDARQSIRHQTRFVTGLSFTPEPGEEVHDYSGLDDCIRTVYSRYKCHGRDVLAYKGGIFEKAILDRLGIPNLDLSSYRCPKYETLLKQNRSKSPYVDCGHHGRIAKGCVVHCPLAEVAAFRDWMMMNFPPSATACDLADPCPSIAESSRPSSPADWFSDRSSSSDCS